MTEGEVDMLYSLMCPFWFGWRVVRDSVRQYYSCEESQSCVDGRRCHLDSGTVNETF
jgi:hypothetical protein